MRRNAVWLAWRTARRLSVLSLLANLASAGLLAGFIASSGELLGAIPAAAEKGWGSPPGRHVVAALVAVGCCFLGTQLLTPITRSLGSLITRQVDGAVRDDLAAASLSAAGLAPFEDQAVLGHLAMAQKGLEEGRQTPGAAVAGLLTLSGLYAQSLFAALLVAVYLSPVIAVGLFGSALLIRRSHRIGLARESRARSQNVDVEKESVYYRRLALSGQAGKELRVFGLANWLSGRFREVSIRGLAATLEVRREVHGNRFIPPVLIATAVSVASLLWVVGQAIAGTVSIQGLVVTLQAGYVCLSIGNYFIEDWQTQDGLVAHSELAKFKQAMAASDDAELRRHWPGTRDPGPAPQTSLQFRDVSFHYPGRDEYVLNGLDLHIPVGRSLAIVGVNGVGKTTLVKLLAGLYEPSSGAILVDGNDLRTLRQVAWQRNVATVFQDFVRYQLTATENIAFTDASDAATRDAVRAAADRAGIAEFLEGLPRGLDTPLSSSYQDGVDLSGGQWQRVALARAFYAMRQGAKVLILDEPTASLDVRAEAAFLDRFVDLTRGLTTVVISHRFATVRRADKIAVLADGRIVEEGTHRSLLDEDTRYRWLFELQAERFASETTDSGAEAFE